MKQHLPKNFNTQTTINNIAFMVNDANDYSNPEKVEKLVPIVENLISLHNNIKSLVGSDTKINKLEGINWKEGTIEDIDDLISSADTQIEYVQAKAYNDMTKLIIKSSKNVRGITPEEIRSEHDKIIMDFKSIGYKTNDRMVSVKSDNMQSLDAMNEILKTDTSLDFFVDSKLTGRTLDIYFPSQYSSAVQENIQNFNSLCEEEDEHISMNNISIVAEYIPGLKDIDDVRRHAERKKEMESEMNM